jgi:hypothetical protein
MEPLFICLMEVSLPWKLRALDHPSPKLYAKISLVDHWDNSKELLPFLSLDF